MSMLCLRTITRSTIGLLALTASVASVAYDECAGALIADNYSGSYSDVTTLSAVKLAFGESKKDEENSIEAKTPIKGVMASFDAKAAKSSADSYFNNSSLKWDKNRLESVATQKLSESAVEAYKACRSTLPTSGVRVIVFDASEGTATVSVTWLSPPGAPTGVKGDVALVGGKLNEMFPTYWNTGEKVTRIITRQKDKDLIVVANIGGFSAAQLVSQMPPPQPLEPLEPKKPAGIAIGSCKGEGGVKGVRMWGPPSEYCNDIHAWGRYDAQTQVVTEIGSCLGQGGVQGVRLYGPIDADCGGIAAWGKYTNPVIVTSTGISSCKGHGAILEAQNLWGPTGELCGGMTDPLWGKYDSGTKKE
ncbi:hypothetical protein [Pseudomonas sichuanensis]|uniref:Uncharacterized protein n=1 Tax=Pseudomonas sichuanensis TaxID=2213015 RepID=A0ABV0DBR2_9PSED